MIFLTQEEHDPEVRHYRVVAPHFVAGVTVDDEASFIRIAPPILGWSIGKDWLWFRSYALRKGWRIEPLEGA